MEATGSYWMTAATLLHHRGYQVSVINPAQAHNFAKALLKRAKTDAIDAQTLAQLGATLMPAPWTPPDAVYAEVYQRLAHRDNLVDMRVQLRNQLHWRDLGPSGAFWRVLGPSPGRGHPRLARAAHRAWEKPAAHGGSSFGREGRGKGRRMGWVGVWGRERETLELCVVNPKDQTSRHGMDRTFILLM